VLVLRNQLDAKSRSSEPGYPLTYESHYENAGMDVAFGRAGGEGRDRDGRSGCWWL